MNKEEFLNKLKEKLSILETSEVDDIIEEYSDHIDEKIKDGTSEIDAIKEFGNIDELVKDILSAYKINYKKDGLESFIDDIIYSAKEVFDKIIKIISHGSITEIVKLLLSIIIILLVIWLLRIPFDIIENFINNIFNILPGRVEELVDTIVNVFINVAYALASIILLIKLLKEKLLANYVFKEETEEKNDKSNLKKETKNKTKGEVKKEEIVYKKDNSFFDFISDMFMLAIKIIASFVLIPCVFGIVISSVGFAALILFSIKYYMFFGPIISCLGALCGCIWLTEVIFRFIVNKKIPFLKSFILFIVSLVLFGIGIGISIIEVSKLTFKDINVEQIELKNYEFNTNEYSEVLCYDCVKIEKEIDNSIEEKKYIIYVYGTEYDEIVTDVNKKDYLVLYYISDEQKVINNILNEIKKGNVTSYNTETDLFNYRYIKIVANENTLNNIHFLNEED